VASPVQRRNIPSSSDAYNVAEPQQPKRPAEVIEAQHPWLGQVVDGKFPLRQYLGGSDHSDVFLTEVGQPRPQKAVIKLILAQPANASRQLARWSSTAVLSHRHLQRIFQAGRCRLGEMDLLYLVMEYPEENLSQVLPQRPLTAEETREMLQPVLEALTYLHGRNLVHGQLKPENILVIGNRLKISSGHVSLAGEFATAPSAYDPPEAPSAGGSAAGDMWSLGAMLGEALTQQIPAWDGIEGKDPELPANIPQPYTTIVRNCLRFDPERRWNVAQVTIQHRDPALQPALEMLAPQGAGTPETRPVQWRYIVPAAVVLLAALVGWKIFSGPTPQRQTTPASAQSVAQPAAKPSPVTRATEQAARRAASEPAAPQAVTQSPVLHDSAQSSSDAVLHRALPDVPQSARDTISGNVRVGVKVQVDAAGNVIGTSLDSPGPSKYFARLAEQAAHDWKFAPARGNGQSVPSEWVLHFAFGRSATDVVPTRVAP
jgi:TonB family protein